MIDLSVSSVHPVAHQGGWDELLLFVVPVLAVIGFVVWAERKARARKQESVTGDPGASARMPGRDQSREDQS